MSGERGGRGGLGVKDNSQFWICTIFSAEVRKLRTFTLSKILLVFHFGQKDSLSKIQSRKNGYLKEMALPNLIVPKFSAKLFPGFKVFLATHITKKIF